MRRTSPFAVALLTLLITTTLAQPPTTTRPTTYPVLAPAAHWGLRYLARAQYPTGGWGQQTEAPRPAYLREFVHGPIAFDKQVLVYPPGIVDTCTVTMAFLEAGRSPVRGDGAKELRRAIDFVYGAVGPGAHLNPAPLVNQNPYQRMSLNAWRVIYVPSLEYAASLELFLAIRDRVTDPALRRDIDILLPILVKRILDTQQDDGAWADRDGVTRALGDALVTRALMIADRNGVPVDRAALGRARQAVLRSYDPTTGESGDESEAASLECAMTLDILYQTDLTARATVTTAARNAALPGATPADAQTARNAAAAATAAHDALVQAQQKFFEKLFKRNKPVAKPRAAAAASATGGTTPASRPAANPLDAPNPLDTNATAGDAEAQDRREVGIPVPVTQPDAISYLLLLESLQESTHPLARPFTDGIVNSLAGKQHRSGYWYPRVHFGRTSFNEKPIDVSNDADPFLTACIVRALLVPAPPHPPASAGAPAK